MASLVFRALLDFRALAHVICATPSIDGIWQLSGVTVLPKSSILEATKISAVQNNFSVDRIWLGHSHGLVQKEFSFFKIWPKSGITFFQAAYNRSSTARNRTGGHMAHTEKEEFS